VDLPVRAALIFWGAVFVVNFVILAAFLAARWALVVEYFLEDGIVKIVLYVQKWVYQPGRMGSFLLLRFIS
jgi:predicted membrane protein